MSEEPVNPISFRMDADTRAELEALAKRDGVTFSKVVQTAIKQFLVEQKAIKYLVAFMTEEGLHNVELPGEKAISPPLELSISIKNAMRDEGQDPSYNPSYCEPISMWEFEKPSDNGGDYLVFTQSSDTRGGLSYVTFQVTSTKPITNLEQLLELTQESADKGLVMLMAVTGVLKLKS
ncbi:hypothetical protein BH11PAT2_BH11PAT2_03760 [soil metagenome]